MSYTNGTLTSVSRHISDLVAVHSSSWYHPVNGGRGVSDIREADSLGWTQVWHKRDRNSGQGKNTQKYNV